MNQNSLLLVFFKINNPTLSTLMALFTFSIFSASLNPMPINIHAQTGAGINTTFSHGNFSLQEEKQIVQKELADLMTKAISIGAGATSAVATDMILRKRSVFTIVAFDHKTNPDLCLKFL
jgi:hypothetical protein